MVSLDIQRPLRYFPITGKTGPGVTNDILATYDLERFPDALIQLDGARYRI